MTSVDVSDGCAVIRELENDIALQPGSLSGISAFIEDCRGKKVFVFDVIDEVRVENCVDCHVILGPASGTVNILGCTGT